MFYMDRANVVRWAASPRSGRIWQLATEVGRIDWRKEVVQ